MVFILVYKPTNLAKGLHIVDGARMKPVLLENPSPFFFVLLFCYLSGCHWLAAFFVYVLHKFTLIVGSTLNQDRPFQKEGWKLEDSHGRAVNLGYIIFDMYRLYRYIHHYPSSQATYKPYVV